MPVKGYFPFGAVEDTKAGVVWAAQLAIECSWQMEFYRRDDGMAFSGGLADREFAILSFRQTLRKVSVESVIKDASYIVECLEKTVRENYAHILNRDLVKDMVENLQKIYPALSRGVVPERISYGYLTDVFKQLLERGLAPWYFSKIIEIMDSECRRNPSITEEELVCTIGKKVQEK